MIIRLIWSCHVTLLREIEILWQRTNVRPVTWRIDEWKSAIMLASIYGYITCGRCTGIKCISRGGLACVYYFFSSPFCSWLFFLVHIFSRYYLFFCFSDLWCGLDKQEMSTPNVYKYTEFADSIGTLITQQKDLCLFFHLIL